MRRLFLTVGFVTIAVFPGTATAQPGTPTYESSDPAPGEMAHQRVEEVSVTFNELLDPSAAELTVSACGRVVDDGAVSVTGFTVEVGVEDNPVGTYTVAYKVSGADDTPAERESPTEGSFAFSYHSTRCGSEEGTENGEHDGHNDHQKEDEGSRHEGHGTGSRHEDDHDGESRNGRHSASHAGHDMHSDEHTAEEHAASSHSRGKHGGRGEGHDKEHGGGSKPRHEHFNGGDAPDRGRSGRESAPSKPNDALNLALVLLIPAGMGAAGGRMLRRTAVRPRGSLPDRATT